MLRERKRVWAISPNGRKSQRNYRAKSPKALRYLYIASANRRGLQFNVPEEVFATLINKDCVYCGHPALEKRNGIDRMDNAKGYIMGNIVSCCFKCNQMKGKLTVEEFLEHIRSILNHAT